MHIRIKSIENVINASSSALRGGQDSLTVCVKCIYLFVYVCVCVCMCGVWACIFSLYMSGD